MGTDGQAKPRHYKELLVWQKGMTLAKLVYKLTAKFPADERYGLTSQLRRAAVSVPSNIAEGQARKGTNEFLQFLSVAEGSLAELETQLLLSVELGFAQNDEVGPSLEEIDELQKMLVALKRTLSSFSPLATRHFYQGPADDGFKDQIPGHSRHARPSASGDRALEPR